MAFTLEIPFFSFVQFTIENVNVINIININLYFANTYWRLEAGARCIKSNWIIVCKFRLLVG